MLRIVILVLLMAGCAAMPSSTDRHGERPPICDFVKVDQRMVTRCCYGETCWYE